MSPGDLRALRPDDLESLHLAVRQEVERRANLVIWDPALAIEAAGHRWYTNGWFLVRADLTDGLEISIRCPSNRDLQQPTRTSVEALLTPAQGSADPYIADELAPLLALGTVRPGIVETQPVSVWRDGEIVALVMPCLLNGPISMHIGARLSAREVAR